MDLSGALVEGKRQNGKMTPTLVSAQLEPQHIIFVSAEFHVTSVQDLVLLGSLATKQICK